MFVLLGAVCFFSRINCTPVGMIGRPLKTEDACLELKHKFDDAIKPISWLDGLFTCIEDEAI